MPKLTRVTFLQFAANVNAAADICEFGTPATGTPVYTANMTTLQANSAWLTGWAAETIASNRPFLEDMNAYCAVVAYMIAYQFEMGIPEYDSGTTYYIDSIVQYNGLLYQSLVDNNTGNTPTIGANWSQYTAPAPYVKCSNTQAQNTAGGSATSGSWGTVPLNTKDNDTSSIATLSSNQISIPAGTYRVSGFCTFFNTDVSQIRLYNITDSSLILTGLSVNCTTDNDNHVDQFPSNINGQFTISGTKTIALQYQVSNTQNTNGLGAPCNFGPEVYATLELTKVS